MRPLRKYESIWKELKEDGSAYLRANQEVHGKIIKAVIKEKHRDIEFKEALKKVGQKAILKTQIDGLDIFFTLEIYTGGYKV